MPFRIAKSFTIESGHLLTKHAGACQFPHGHSRTIEIIVTADGLDERDMVCDFAALKTVAADVVTRYDHAFMLNTADRRFAEFRAAYGDRIIPFVQTDPTTEVLAREIFAAVKLRLADAAAKDAFPCARDLRLERVRVTETASAWAEYCE